VSESERRFPSFAFFYSHANVISYTQWVEVEQERKWGAVRIDNRSIISGMSLGWGARELFLSLATWPDITALHNSGNVHINLTFIVLSDHMLVSMRLLGSALQETSQNKFFLHTFSLRCFVFLKTAITCWYITNSVFVVTFKTLTKTQSHITLLALDLNSFFYSSCRTSSAVGNGQWLLKFTSSRVTCFWET
jgi:hypothetical protein